MAAGIRYFQDPIHGTIAVPSLLLQRLIDSRAVQRLKHVRQLGTSYFAFPGAEHSRFSHSLGSMHLMGRVLEHLSLSEGLRLSKTQMENAQIAALLHDAGHSAFSHTLEAPLGFNHEAMTQRLIKEDPQLKKILGMRSGAVADILSGSAKAPKPLHDLVSSQLDVDRLDYLARDAYHTGVNSGRIDLGRIIASLSLYKGRLVVKEKAWLALEEYFLARYFMYWKVYFHKTSRGLELILSTLVRRASQLRRKGQLELGLTPALAAMLEDPNGLPTKDFLDHDDSDLMVAIKAWRLGPDAVLADLSDRFLNRRKFKMIKEARSGRHRLSAVQRKKARSILEKRWGENAALYLIEDQFGGRPYNPQAPVMLVGDKGKPVDLASISSLVREVSRERMSARYYVPAEDAAAVKRILG